MFLMKRHAYRMAVRREKNTSIDRHVRELARFK
uniref:Uncharacterized protein n=1 Tax=viral metagenome TaxID=1070528 RepID=A0A6C0K1D8_9ZZZZ